MIVLERDFHNGYQTVWRFANGYGASVVNHEFSYGVELAVLTFNGPDALDFERCYTTPITNGVIGDLTPERLTELLATIEALPTAHIGAPENGSLPSEADTRP